MFCGFQLIMTMLMEVFFGSDSEFPKKKQFLNHVDKKETFQSREKGNESD